ncbi:hypothetical protein AAFF_G00167510, partial [Aldrovandia affinis]
DPAGEGADPAREDSARPPFGGAAHPPVPTPLAPLLQTPAEHCRQVSAGGIPTRKV